MPFPSETTTRTPIISKKQQPFKRWEKFSRITGTLTQTFHPGCFCCFPTFCEYSKCVPLVTFWFMHSLICSPSWQFEVQYWARNPMWSTAVCFLIVIDQTRKHLKERSRNPFREIKIQRIGTTPRWPLQKAGTSSQRINANKPILYSRCSLFTHPSPRRPSLTHQVKYFLCNEKA